MSDVLRIVNELCENEDLENVIDDYKKWRTELDGKTYEGETVEFEGKTLLLKHIDKYGGEGKGDLYWVVFSVQIDDAEPVFVRRNGWYASYEGVSWHDFEIVKPKEIKTTVWEAE